MFLRSLASGRGTFVNMASVVPGGFEVAVDSKAVIDLYEPVSDSILKPDLVSWYK